MKIVKILVKMDKKVHFLSNTAHLLNKNVLGLIFVYYPLKGTGSGFPPASHVRLEKSAIWYIPNGNWAFNVSKGRLFLWSKNEQKG